MLVRTSTGRVPDDVPQNFGFESLFFRGKLRFFNSFFNSFFVLSGLGGCDNCCPVRDGMLVERRPPPCHRPVRDGMWIFRTYGTNEVGAMGIFYRYIVPNGTKKMAYHRTIYPVGIAAR